MCAASANSDFSKLRFRLDAAGSLLIITHARPDGDALGSAAALAAAARFAAREARIIIPDILPGRYEFLFASDRPEPPEQFEPLAQAADAIVVLDTRAEAQLGGLAEPLCKYRDKTVVIDHHATAGDVGAVQWVDVSAAATGVMMAELLEALNWPLELPVVEALTVAVVSDTGWLRYSNTDGRTLRTMAMFVDEGARLEQIYARLYYADSIGRVRLLQRVLGSLELHCDDALAVMTLLDEDFAEAGAARAETEDLVNEAFRLKTVRAVMLLVETDEAIRVSLRSRGDVDVARLAERFGGGGHACAAGIRIRDDIDSVKRQLIRALADELGG